MEKYELRPEIPGEIKKNLSKYPPITQKLLYYRGVTDETSAEKFFNPNYDDLGSPFLLKDIEKAVSRILEAVEKNEKILIYSDYDADGIPGAVILHDYFEKIGFNNFTNYIPHRNDEGFGLNIEAVKSFKEEGISLIITIDCGINDVLEVKEANRLNIDVIITDHHLAGDILPEALAIINPNQKGDEYPFKFLCGSAVVFKLVQALIERSTSTLVLGWDKWLLDMVGLATISDMVPLVEENRILSHYGLLVLRKTRRHGLKNLYNEARLKSKFLNEDDISYVITPRINAASRMDEVYTAFNLLKTKDIVEAKEGAKRLSNLNNERKILTAGIVKEIKRKLSLKGEIPKVIVAGNPKWTPSILGLVAQNLAEEFNRPVFLWGRNGYEEIKGSCRSDQKVDLFLLMQNMSHFFTHFGGHKFSGGFGVSPDKIHFLEQEILKNFESYNSSPQNDEKILIDYEISFNNLGWDIVNELERFAPFGVGNPKPVFIIKNVLLPEVKKFGKHGEHLKFDLNQKISAIKFFSKPEDFQKDLTVGEKASFVVFVEKSYFRNFPELRLRIIDII